MPVRIPVNLPPLRTKIRRSFSLLTILYALLGVFMVASVFLAVGVTPKAIHMNYDSIEVAVEMDDSWNAIRSPELFAPKPPQYWIDRFENALTFENGNITEPGETELIRAINALWQANKNHLGNVSVEDFQKMHELLNGVIAVNKKGMFKLAEDNTNFGHEVFLGSIGFFIVSLLLSFLLGDGLANRLARPLKEMAEELRENPSVGKKLRLPEPNSLEMRILTNEVTSLWDRVTDFKKANIEVLAAQTERLETVLASVEDAILVLDNAGTILHCGEGMLRILNLSHDETIGHRWTDLPTANGNYLKLRGLLQSTMEGDNAVELTAGAPGDSTESGTQKLVYAGRHRDIITKSGAKVGELYLLHDITESRHRERLKAEFIGVLSHELKTPLQSLGTAAELLNSRKEHVSDEVKMLIETINEDVSRIRAVANDFMQVGMADHHSLKLKLERRPMSQLLQEWMKPFIVLARDKAVTLEFEQLGSEVVWANIDAVKFPWAVSNLLANAIRISKPGEKVLLRLNDRVSTEFFYIDIIDEGPGIPDEIQHRMFEPYYQAPRGTSGTSTGFLGLGLTIAKEVVEAHEGMLEYHTNKPHGSVFRIKLPMVAVYT